MARMFSGQERDEIRRILIANGREFFSRSGLKRTSVEELARSAGISSGFFYAFFGSKEELYFEILEQEEQYRDRVFAELLAGGPITAERFADFLERVFTTMEENPILRQLYEEGVYEQLLKKLSPERVEAHIRKDSDSFKQLLSAWQDEGLVVREDLEVLAGLFRSLFFLTLHRQEIGEDVYPRVRRFFLRTVAGSIIINGKSAPPD